jgi:hypothetical protein
LAVAFTGLHVGAATCSASNQSGVNSACALKLTDASVCAGLLWHAGMAMPIRLADADQPCGVGACADFTARLWYSNIPVPGMPVVRSSILKIRNRP